MKKYRTDWTIAVVFLVGFALWAWSVSSEAADRATYINFLVMTSVFCTVIISLVSWFSYAAVTGTTLKFIYLLFYRRTVDISSITEINDQPTYKVAKSAFRSLYVFYKDKNRRTKWIQLRITIFPEKALGNLIKDLKAINPHIELNKYAEKLMKAAS